mmetsp:Transcript_73852/g.196556  ORF Transcript_73852/g.196556 Transcript_73852/m.196556 type:complete len:262 (+) Transcript_73852:355-1140(+)
MISSLGSPGSSRRPPHTSRAWPLRRSCPQPPTRSPAAHQAAPAGGACSRRRRTVPRSDTARSPTARHTPYTNTPQRRRGHSVGGCCTPAPRGGAPVPTKLSGGRWSVERSHAMRTHTHTHSLRFFSRIHAARCSALPRGRRRRLRRRPPAAAATPWTRRSARRPACVSRARPCSTACGGRRIASPWQPRAQSSRVARPPRGAPPAAPPASCSCRRRAAPSRAPPASSRGSETSIRAHAAASPRWRPAPSRPPPRASARRTH